MNSIQLFQAKSKMYQNDINYSIANSVVFDKNKLPEGDYNDNFDTNFSVLDATLQEVLMQCEDQQAVALSFSCKRNPAGQTKTSVGGQEADISKLSFLPTILGSNKLLLEYYVPNRETDAYAGDLVAYTPKVPFIFENDIVTYFDIISCAAPSVKYLCKFSASRVRTLLERRIDIILSSAACNGKTTIILGAWGCGGNGLDASVVAEAFQAVLDTGYHGVFRNVIFAVPKTVENDHFDIFNSYFGGELFAEG